MFQSPVDNKQKGVESYPLQSTGGADQMTSNNPQPPTSRPFSHSGRALTDVMGSNAATTAQQRRKMVWTLVLAYAPDWILSIILVAVFGALESVPGFKRDFSLEDTSLRHPFAVHERVPNWALYIICAVAPVVLQPIVNLLTVRSWWDLHNSLLGLLLSLSLTGVVTQFTKITVGRPRPDVISRCIPRPGSADPPLGLSTVDICTQTVSSILHDGWRSFPSGHSSLSFAGLGFLSFYLAGKLHLFDTCGHARKAWVAITPLAGATLVAVSRTMDYRHHWQDVTAGAILGLVMSYFSYRQYYPSLASPYSHRPYFPRNKGEEGLSLPLHRSRVNSPHEHYEVGGANGGYGRYRDRLLDEEDVDLDGVPPGTVPKNERGDMGDVWRNENAEQDSRSSHLSTR